MINLIYLGKNSDLNTKFATLATKSELKAEQDKIVKLGDDGFQNMFVYQPAFNTLELKKNGQEHRICY